MKAHGRRQALCCGSGLAAHRMAASCCDCSCRAPPSPCAGCSPRLPAPSQPCKRSYGTRTTMSRGPARCRSSPAVRPHAGCPGTAPHFQPDTRIHLQRCALPVPPRSHTPHPTLWAASAVGPVPDGRCRADCCLCTPARRSRHGYAGPRDSPSHPHEGPTAATRDQQQGHHPACLARARCAAEGAERLRAFTATRGTEFADRQGLETLRKVEAREERLPESRLCAIQSGCARLCVPRWDRLER
jgi:hypothetical protein